MNLNISRLSGERGIVLNKRLHSFVLQTSLAALACAFAAFVFLFVSGYASDPLIEYFTSATGYVQKKGEAKITVLQNYVTDNELSMKDSDQLDHWVESNHGIYLEMAVIEDGECVYDSLKYLDERNLAEFIENNNYSIREQVVFADGTADVYMHANFDAELYYSVEAARIAASVAIFILLFVLYLQKKIGYILKLEKEIRILQAGDLDREITVEGQDEIASLARGLDSMRRALIENEKKQEDLTNANYLLVVNMSHELRTPLTALMLNLELLSNPALNEEKREKYLDKSKEKAAEIKSICDRLLARFISSARQQQGPLETMSARAAFEDRLSVISGSLCDFGYKFTCDLQWPDANVEVHENKLDSLFDHIHASLLVHADSQSPVFSHVHEVDGSLEISVVYKQNESVLFTPAEATLVPKLMKEEKGSCDRSVEDGIVCDILRFPLIRNKK